MSDLPWFSPPAKCRTCGRIVDVPIHLSGFSGEASFPGLKVSCPCGGVAEAVTGNFRQSQTTGALSVRGATSDDMEVLRQAGLRVEELLAQGAGTDAITEAVAAISPELAKSLPRSRRKMRQIAQKWALGGAAVAAGAVVNMGTTDLYNKVVHPHSGSPDKPGQSVQIPEGSPEGDVELEDGTKIHWERPAGPR